MALRVFLEQLFNGEPLVVGAQWDPVALDGGQPAALEVLRERHGDDMLELAGGPLELDEEAALWGARRLYLVAQAFRLRDLEEATLEKVFGAPLRGRLTVERLHAVDLSFRFLPSVLDLARGLAPGDALIAIGRRLLEPWPLSSVGVAQIAVPSKREAPLLTHRGLRTRYLDRIFARQDFARLERAELAAAARAAVGIHRELVSGWSGYTPVSLSS